MSYKVTLIAGDGVGPEVTDAAKLCLKALDVDIDWEVMLAGQPALEKEGSLLPARTIESIRKNKVALKGPIITPIGGGFRSINVALRQELGLFACVRPSRYLEGTKSRYPGTNIIVIRENSEDLYAGIEFKEREPFTEKLISTMNKASEKKISPHSALSIKPISQAATHRLAHFAFQLARKEKRKKVTCVHKANIMKYTDGLFLKTFTEVAKKYSDIASSNIIVDNLCMQLVINPVQFDILFLPNLYGDIISDLCAGLTGGLGIAAGANIGESIALFEPVHGSAPKYAGQNRVNPTAMILSAALMLRYIKEEKLAATLEEAVYQIIKEGRFVTYDLKPNRDDPTSVGTKEMAEAIVAKIKKLLKGK